MSIHDLIVGIRYGLYYCRGHVFHSYVVIPVGLLVTFTVLYGLDRFINDVLHIAFPASVLGMIINLVGLCTLKLISDSKIRHANIGCQWILHHYLMMIKPSMNFVLKWINVFFLPAFIVLPLSEPITFVEVAKIAATFVAGFLVLFVIDVYLMRTLVYSYERYWKQRFGKQKSSLGSVTDDDEDAQENNEPTDSTAQAKGTALTTVPTTVTDATSIASSALGSNTQEIEPESPLRSNRLESLDSGDDNNVVDLIELTDLNRKQLDITTIDLAELRPVKTEPTKVTPVHRPENPFAGTPSPSNDPVDSLSIPERVYIGDQSYRHLKHTNPHDAHLDFLHFSQLSRPHTIDLAVNSSYLTTTVTQDQVPVPEDEDENHTSTDPKEQEEELAMLATLLPLSKSTVLFITKYIDWLVYGLMFVVSLPFYYIGLIHLMLPYHLSISILVYYVALLMPEKFPKLKKIGYHPILFLTGVILFIFFIGSMIYHQGKPVGFLIDLRYYKTGKKYSNLFNGKRMYNNGEIAPANLHVTKLDKWPGCGDVLSSLMDVSIVALSLPMFSFRRDFVDNFGFIMPVLLVSCAASYLIYPIWSHAIGISPARSIGFIGRSVTLALGTPLITTLEGSVNLMSVCTILSGICGVLIGDPLYALLRVPKNDYATRGITLGINCGAIATAHLLKSDPRAALMSSLSFSIFGMMMIILSSIGVIRLFIHSLVGW